MKKYGFFLILLLLLSSPVCGDESREIPAVYRPLVHRLSQEGFDSEFLSQLLADPRSEFLPEMASIRIGQKERPDIYAKFLTPERILLSKRFLRENIKILKKMEKKYHVEKELIVSILLVESGFGENIGRHRVVPTLASMTLIDSPEILSQTYQTLQNTDPDLSYTWVEDRARKKADWAFHELRCFLRIVRNEKIDPLEVMGSYAGALGMAQFIPSSYLVYAQSKKGLGNWLIDKEEAIFSIAHYLKSNGWKRNLSRERKKKVIWAYNRSEPYVETILQVARKINTK